MKSRLIIFLIVLAIPLGGIASFEMDTEKCPMQSATEDPAADHSCCEEPARPSGESPCKPGQECSTTSVFHLSASIRVLISPAHNVFTTETPRILTPEATELLRPPRA